MRQESQLQIANSEDYLEPSQTTRDSSSTRNTLIANNFVPHLHPTHTNVECENIMLERTSLNVQEFSDINSCTQNSGAGSLSCRLSSEVPTLGKPDEQLPRKVRELKTERNNRTWLWEIAAILLSLCALTASTIILGVYNGKALSEWHLFISINTVISILATISRIALAFAVTSCLGQAKWNWFRRRPDALIAFERCEAASRGPLGGIQLLVWLHIRQLLLYPILFNPLSY
jgi:hypothetical protein